MEEISEKDSKTEIVEESISEETMDKVSSQEIKPAKKLSEKNGVHFI